MLVLYSISILEKHLKHSNAGRFGGKDEIDEKKSLQYVPLVKTGNLIYLYEGKMKV